MTHVINCIPDTIYRQKDGFNLLNCNLIHPKLPIIYLIETQEPFITKLIAVDLITKNVISEININELDYSGDIVGSTNLIISEDGRYLAITFDNNLVVIDLEQNELLLNRVFDWSISGKVIWINSLEPCVAVIVQRNVYIINTKNEIKHTFNSESNFIIQQLYFNKPTNQLLIYASKYNEQHKFDKLYYLLDTISYTTYDSSPLVKSLCDIQNENDLFIYNDYILVTIKKETCSFPFTLSDKEIVLNFVCFNWSGEILYKNILPNKLGVYHKINRLENFLIINNQIITNDTTNYLIDIKTGKMSYRVDEEFSFSFRSIFKIQNKQFSYINYNQDDSTIEIIKYKYDYDNPRDWLIESKKTFKIDGFHLLAYNSFILKTANLQYDDLNNKLLILNKQYNILISIELP